MLVPIATPLTCKKKLAPKVKQLYWSTKTNNDLITVTDG